MGGGEEDESPSKAGPFPSQRRMQFRTRLEEELWDPDEFMRCKYKDNGQ